MSSGTEQLQNTDYDYLIKFLALGDSGKFTLINFIFIGDFRTTVEYRYRIISLLHHEINESFFCCHTSNANLRSQS